MENAVKLVGREVFEVLYSPVKAFRKIIEKPDLKGNGGFAHFRSGNFARERICGSIIYLQIIIMH